jgi:hypothetical protein
MRIVVIGAGVAGMAERRTTMPAPPRPGPTRDAMLDLVREAGAVA